MANSLPRAEKRAAIESWARRQLGSLSHEHRVLRISSELVELTAPIHNLSPADRHLLDLAILAHDVGRSIDDDEHPTLGARILLKDESLPITPSERRALAYLTQYHRGRVPAPRQDDILASTDDHDALRAVLAFLRAADSLDSRWLGSPQLVMSLHRRTVRIDCYVAKDTPKIRRLFTRKKKFRLLEEVLRCQIAVDLALTDALTLVA